MLVRLDFADSDCAGRTGKVKWFPSREEVVKATRNSIQTSFGTSASDALMEVQGKLRQPGVLVISLLLLVLLALFFLILLKLVLSQFDFAMPTLVYYFSACPEPTMALFEPVSPC